MPRTAAPPFALWLLVVAAPVTLAADPPYRDPEITAKDRRHWSFVPPTRPAVPTVARAGWVRNPIDAFVLAKLEANGIAPAPEADKLTLVRRVTFDLTGLPP